jgi:hypothetical protein
MGDEAGDELYMVNVVLIEWHELPGTTPIECACMQEKMV